jgi:hypothetical protein
MSIQYSPLELFIDTIKNEIELDTNVRFYVSTDADDVAISLKDVFGDRIIYFKKDVSRDTERGMQNAMLDMTNLSRCKKIYGSYYSSFSFIAAQYGNIELTELKKT